MTNGGMSRNLMRGITLKIGFPLLIGLVTLVSAEASGMSGRSSFTLAAAITFGFALILLVVDNEIRISVADERMTEGFAKIGKSAELPSMTEHSILGTTLVRDFLETASRTDERVNPLLKRLAQQEVERVISFVRQVPVGGQIVYEGEDRDWLLGLTRGAERTIDAISLPTVDAGMSGFDGGLWTSDLGIRYLELQRQAISRKVRIRRIFVIAEEQMPHDETFLAITQIQRDIGVEVRMLDHEHIPAWMQSMIFDFIVFDGTISYETTPTTALAVGQTRPGILRTQLAPMPTRVRDLEAQFEQLWDAADPERPLGERSADSRRVGVAWSREHVPDPVD